MTIRSEDCYCHPRTAETSYELASGQLIPDMNRDDVAEVLGIFETYEGSLSREDALAHALVGWRACRERRLIQERAAARRAEIAGRVRAEFGGRL